MRGGRRLPNAQDHAPAAGPGGEITQPCVRRQDSGPLSHGHGRLPRAGLQGDPGQGISVPGSRRFRMYPLNTRNRL